MSVLLNKYKLSICLSFSSSTDEEIPISAFYSRAWGGLLHGEQLSPSSASERSWGPCIFQMKDPPDLLDPSSSPSLPSLAWYASVGPQSTFTLHGSDAGQPAAVQQYQMCCLESKEAMQGIMCLYCPSLVLSPSSFIISANAWIIWI